MDSDAASEAASSAAKSLDEKSSTASETPLISERKWQRTHAWIQGLTMALLVRQALLLTHTGCIPIVSQRQASLSCCPTPLKRCVRILTAVCVWCCWLAGWCASPQSVQRHQQHPDAEGLVRAVCVRPGAPGRDLLLLCCRVCNQGRLQPHLW